jgi:hypothetical protein
VELFRKVRLRLDFSATLEMTKSGGGLFGMTMRSKFLELVCTCNYKILRQSLLRATATRAGENDKFLWAFFPVVLIALVDYVITPSHLERFLGYARNDKRWNRVCA